LQGWFLLVIGYLKIHGFGSEGGRLDVLDKILGSPVLVLQAMVNFRARTNKPLGKRKFK